MPKSSNAQRVLCSSMRRRAVRTTHLSVSIDRHVSRCADSEDITNRSAEKYRSAILEMEFAEDAMTALRNTKEDRAQCSIAALLYWLAQDATTRQWLLDNNAPRTLRLAATNTFRKNSMMPQIVARTLAALLPPPKEGRCSCCGTVLHSSATHREGYRCRTEREGVSGGGKDAAEKACAE